jgi:hypothetical protein
VTTIDPRAAALAELDALDADDVAVPLNDEPIGLTAPAPEDERERRIDAEVERERARREARRRLDAEERGPLVLPAFETLTDHLARPVTEPEWQIRDVMPRASRVMMPAQFKAGKTTLSANYIRSRVDGDPFLGRFHVEPMDGAMLLFDLEMSHAKMLAWLRDQGIIRTDRVIPISLRGRPAAFNPLDPRNRATWAALAREWRVTGTVFDCLRPALDALHLNEHTEAGQFLVAFDAFLAEAGIVDALMVHHMGHVNERSRGDSRLRDWPDVEWRLVRRDDDPASARYLTCYGRDVDVPESALHYDPLTRRLTIEHGVSRREETSRAALEDVLAVLRAKAAPLSGRQLKDELSESEHPRDAIDAALKLGGRTGALAIAEGPRRAKLYSLPRVSECPGVSGQCPADSENECPTTIRESDTHTDTASVQGVVSGPDTHTPLTTDGKPFVFDGRPV